MKKLILLVVMFNFCLVMPAFADNIAVKCNVPTDSEFACKNFTDMPAADVYKNDMQAKTIACTISTETCPASKPSAETLKKDPGVVKLDNPLNLATDVKVIIGTIIKGVLGIMGGLVLLMVVYGGSTWITAAGSPEKVKSGSQTILWALLGAIITTASYIILSGIMKYF